MKPDLNACEKCGGQMYYVANGAVRLHQLNGDSECPIVAGKSAAAWFHLYGDNHDGLEAMTQNDLYTMLEAYARWREQK